MRLPGDITDGAGRHEGLWDEAAWVLTLERPVAWASCWIDECYAADDAVTIVQALADHPALTPGPAPKPSGPVARCRWCSRCARRPPRTGVARWAAVLDQDRALARTTMADPADFVEVCGPRWSIVTIGHAGGIARLADVDEAEVAARFVG